MEQGAKKEIERKILTSIFNNKHNFFEHRKEKNANNSKSDILKETF